MPILVVGSVALDSVQTPFGEAERVVGGSAVFFSAAASLFGPVRVVGVVGEDYPLEKLEFLAERGVDLSGIEQAEGESFFWAGRYSHDLNSRDTLETRLGVFADFRPRVPDVLRPLPPPRPSLPAGSVSDRIRTGGQLARLPRPRGQRSVGLGTVASEVE